VGSWLGSPIIVACDPWTLPVFDLDQLSALFSPLRSLFFNTDMSRGQSSGFPFLGPFVDYCASFYSSGSHSIRYGLTDRIRSPGLRPQLLKSKT